MKEKLVGLFVIVVLVSVLVTSCAPTPAPTAAPKATEAATKEGPKEPAPEFIEFGASIPMTGKYGALGGMVLPGYEYAVEDINAAGGIMVEEYGVKIPVRLTVYDDESDPAKATSKLETLYSEQNVTAYLGGAGSDMHAAASAVAEKNKVPYCGIAFALWKIHQQGYKYLFSPFPKSPAQAKGVYEFLNEALPEGGRPTKVAIFSEGTDWGKELGGLWEQNAKEFGYEIVVHEEYAPGSTDYSTMILKAKDAGAETLMAVPTGKDVTPMVKQMVELGWAPKYALVIRGPEGNKWGSDMGKDGDYLTIFPGWHNALNFPGVAELNAKYQAEFGRPADLLTGPAYTCVQIFADAITRAGTLDRDAIRDAVAATDMVTVDGPVTFNEDGTGNVLNPMVQWQNGVQQLIWPFDQKSADFMYPAPPFAER